MVKPGGERKSRYNRRVICGYVSGPEVLRKYEVLAERISAVLKRDKTRKYHKVTVSALAGRLLERMIPFLVDQTTETLARELVKEDDDAKAKAKPTV